MFLITRNDSELPRLHLVYLRGLIGIVSILPILSMSADVGETSKEPPPPPMEIKYKTIAPNEQRLP